MGIILKVLLLWFSFLLYQSNGQSEIRFVINCLPIEECTTLSWLPESTLSDISKCGGTIEAPKYKCPLDMEFCNCKVLHECKVLNELANARKFDELKNKYVSCGFDRKNPKFCCPLSH